MRRRALLAASTASGGNGGGVVDDYFGEIPPESTSFTFPLYLTIPYVGTNDGWREYYREADGISEALKEWFFANAEVSEGMFAREYLIDDPDIYINGEKCSEMWCEVSLGIFADIYFYGNWTECILGFNDNAISLRIYEKIH